MPTKRKPTQLDRIEQMLLEMKHPAKVPEVDHKEPVKEEPLKVGDWVFAKGVDSIGIVDGRIIWPGGVPITWKNGAIERSGEHRCDVRRATPEEVAKHLKEEEERKPLTFGTRVKNGTGSMIYWYSLLNGKHKLIGEGGTFLELPRESFTIL